jgi:type IV pilus assembly protein PilA
MQNPLRRRLHDEAGFTLIELLTVILIIGVLAAIAIPSFLNQKGKANDSAAKSQARNAETAAETYSTDNNGLYTGMEEKKLEAIEPTLSETTSATLTITGVTANEYTVTSTSKATGDAFSIKRTSTGLVERSCTVAGKNGCPSSKSW